mgnify:CR=1 FL=1
MITLALRVIPQAKKQKIIRDGNGRLKCYLVSQPERGKANRELIELLARQLNLPKSALTLVQGETQRDKVVAIQSELSQEAILLLLLGDSQKKIF